MIKTKLIDLSKIKTYPIKKRKSKVKIQDFATCLDGSKTFGEFIESLPQILSGKDFKNMLYLYFKAYRKKQPIIFMMGAHVIKCGLSPIIIQLMKKKLITAVAFNGAGAIHDFEIAYIGQTSEEVGENIKNGSFGMAEETGAIMNQAINEGIRDNLGLGEAVGKKILELDCRYKKYSILANAHILEIPATVHVAIGTDIIHQHPSCSGQAIGEASYHDFLKFTSVVSQLGEGGIVLNFGSAVILPEVFLKALTIGRNLGYRLNNFTTANFDMIYQYRPMQNVVFRPVSKKGQGFNFIGQHEIMLPLLAQAILSKIANS